MTVHDLKVWPEYFGAIRRGDKHFEARERRDRDFKVGDILVLREWFEKEQLYSDRFEVARVTYILEGGIFGVAPGHVIMSIKILKPEGEQS